MKETMRIHKYLAVCGIASRRAAEKLVEEGKVTINRRVAEVGDGVVPGKDIVTVDGKEVKIKNEEYVYIMCHKPRGYITSMQDDRGRKTVLELLEGVNRRVFPVGRLDYNSEGLLLFTNDGELSYRITHPKHRIEKAYRVTVSGKVSENTLGKLRQSMQIDGVMLQAVSVKIIMERENSTAIEIVVSEGKNRQIRKMCENCFLLIRRLKRVRIGEISLGMLPPGKYRFLTVKEVENLKVLCGLK